MDALLETISAEFPSLLFAILALGVAFFAFRYLNQIRNEVSEQVAQQVTLQMSQRLGELRQLTEDAQRQGESLRTVGQEAQSLATGFRAEIEGLTTAVGQEASELERLIGTVKLEIPEDIDWISAETLVVRARDGQDWRMASLLLERVLSDENATAVVLEQAGDVARNHRAFKKALQFYQKAVDRDPERRSARVELHALTAEVNAQARGEALQLLGELVVQQPIRVPWLHRYWNALIELGRYQQMAEFCERLLKRDDLNLSSEAIAHLHRNLAVALRYNGTLEEARIHYEEAYRALPTDEDIVRAYALFLRDEIHDWDSYYRLAQELVALDPADPNYAFLMASALEHVGQDEEATEWIARSWRMEPDVTTGSMLRRLQRRIEAKG